MSGKKSLIIVGIILLVLIVFVYKFSTPHGHMHLAPVVSDNTDSSLSHIDSVHSDSIRK